MNTGVGDAENLGWKLAANYQGWGDRRLLDTYEAERRPVAIRNLAQSYALAQAKSALTVPENIETENPEGEDMRAELGRRTEHALAEEYFCMGIQLGARYDGSPIIASEKGEIPVSDAFTYIPTSHPGGRAPHKWLDNGTALFDHFSKGFTLLRLGNSSTDVEPLLDAAVAKGVPIDLLDEPDLHVRELYEVDLALVRPDQYIAWRGNLLPDNPNDLVDLIIGANTNI